MRAFLARVPIRWVDLDAQGHVNNAAIVDYLQEARVEYLLSGPNAHLLGHGVIVVAHQVEYAGVVTFATEPLEIDLVVADVGASRFTLGYEVRQHGRRAVRARTLLCLFDFERGRPGRLAPGDRAAFAADARPLDPLPELEPWRVGERAHRHPVVVRWSDLDSYGHVNNTCFFNFLGEARVALTSALLPDAIRSSTQAPDRTWLVVRQDVTYVAQMNHRLEPFVVRTAIGRVGRTSVTLAAEVADPLDGAVLARATTVLVHGDAAGRPTPVPAELAGAVERWPAVAGRGRGAAR